MVFEWQDEGKFHRVPKLEAGPPNVYFGEKPPSHDLRAFVPAQAYACWYLTSLAGDVFSTASKDTANPLTGSMFLLEQIGNPSPAPPYDYDESGIVLKG